ncbi:MAG: aminotransferase class V-fold PLP-dependent enzyme [Chloroflexi bacterium]|nr:aminotransferase class V-fold PLP-dependent enzyme [Chloroflexota bacterium]
MQPLDTPSLAEVREREFVIAREYTYLNAASVGPWPVRTVRAVERAAASAQFPNIAHAQIVPPAEPLARERLARLIGAHAEDIVFTANTTHGINLCAHGIDWRPGDNVVVPDREFPSLMITWAHLREHGVEVRFAPWAATAGPTVDEIMAAVDERTRAVSCSLIKWDTGYRVDLDELGRRCAERGCLLIVDAIQGVGAQRLDARAARVSALATHGYKWLMAGFGVGALYVAPEAVDQIRPTFAGHASVSGSESAFEGEIRWRPGAARYAVGGGNAIGQAALAASLSLIEEVGMNTIEEQGRALAELFYDGLRRKGESLRIVSSPDPAHRTAITTFTLGNAERDGALVKELEAQGIIVALRPLGVRVSPHFYNSEAEIARLLDALPG